MIDRRGGLGAALILFLAAAVGAQENPDFTKGGKVPKDSNRDWTLGATGARGWMYGRKLSTSEARQIAVTRVEKGSPADGVLKEGDVILGVEGKRFSTDARIEFGKALTRAESEAGGGRLSLILWRGGKTANTVVKLPVLGTYSATAPYDCEKSKRILEQGCRALAKRVSDPKYKGGHVIVRSLNALALLASGNDDYLPIVRKEAQWAAEARLGGYKTWSYGYVMMFLAEYVIATGDTSVLPGLQRFALEAAAGQSRVGSWGHGFAEPDGRLGGYGMMNAPGVPLTIGMAMAREAGVKDGPVGVAVEKSLRLLRFYEGKGSIPYGDHAPWIQTHDGNGKCSMGAVLFNVVGEPGPAEYFSRASLASHGSERDTGHTGNFFSMTWSLPAVALSGPNATGAWMKEFGAWKYDLARQWDGTFVHQCPPDPKKDKYGNWDTTGATLLAYAQPLRKILLTGKRPPRIPQLDTATAAAIVADGRGWSTTNHNGFYDKLDEKELLSRLGSWSPTVRERAAMALARRKAAVVPKLVEMVGTGPVESRLGACQALAQLRGAAAPAVPALRKAINHEDLWLRVKAAQALAAIGGPAMEAVPDLLERLARPPTTKDPRAMEQRFLCEVLFNRKGGLLGRSLDGVDRTLLRKAVEAGLKNDDGRARSMVGGIYPLLSYEEIKPLLPAIYEAVVTPAPSGIMFANGIRMSGLQLLAKHRIREGLPLCFELLAIDKWGKRQRISGCLRALGQYGAAAKSELPKLRKLEKDLTAHREAKGLKKEIGQVRALIAKLEKEKGSAELRSLR